MGGDSHKNKKKFFVNNLHHKSQALIFGSELAKQNNSEVGLSTGKSMA
jgi:hypothetical protein